MKRIVSFCLALAACTTAALADNDTPVQVAQMPSQARSFIRKHFGDTQVSRAAKGDDGYEVTFVNGNTVDFDARGEWTGIECRNGVVPEAIVPRRVYEYVADNYPGRKIVGLGQTSAGCRAELDDGVVLQFDRDYRLVALD